jgi:hypothetical protein
MFSGPHALSIRQQTSPAARSDRPGSIGGLKELVTQAEGPELEVFRVSLKPCPCGHTGIGFDLTDWRREDGLNGHATTIVVA